MPGKSFHRINLFGRFMKLVYDISKKTAAGGRHPIGLVSGELDIHLGKVSGIFFEKVKISRFKV